MALSKKPGCCCGSCNTTVCVQDCGVGLVGVVVTIVGQGTCTTTAGGCCTIAIPSAGSYTVQASYGGTMWFNASRNLTCGGVLTVNISPTSVICCGAYAIPTTLTLTDALGTVTMWYVRTTGAGNFWAACRFATVTAETVSGAPCVYGPSTSQPVIVCYSMVCNGGSFSLDRNWICDGVSNVLVPSTGATCPSGGPGVDCDASGGHVSTSCFISQDSTGTATPSSSSPFSITFPMSPLGSNVTADPVGGSVTISG